MQFSQLLHAQDSPVAVDASAVARAQAAAQQAAGNKDATKAADGKAKEGEKKEGETAKDGAAEAPAGPTPITREKASGQANPINTEVKWDKEAGSVQFSFQNQSWKNVLNWIADASRLSFQWQELPGDALNLTTTKSYSLEQARDLLNRLLLSRGYTMLVHGEILSVTKLADLKSSLVPRVQPEDLEGLSDHTIVKVSFNLDWLIAEEAVAELQPMLTNAGKINKLSRTNRLEVIDTAISLREMWQILTDEQSDAGQEQLVKKFVLKHRRAHDVVTMLRTLLGLKEPPGAGGASNGGMSSRMMQQMQQQMQQMMQKAQQAGKGGGGGKKEQETRLVLNARENMILVQAAPDQMAIIEKAVAEIDVPGDAKASMLQNMNRMKVYRLETIDPQILADLLQELGDLDPGTTLKVDKKKKSIVAWADIADQLTISTLVERLDSTGREFDVIRLRLLDAEYVAGTIMTLMGPKEKEDNSRSRYRYYGFYGSNDEDEDEDDRSFRVDADLQDNRLLVYANPVEMKEIRRLLQKLGELPDPDGDPDGIRVFELSPDDDPEALKRQLQQLWQRGNKLEFSLPPAQKQQIDQQVQEEDTTASITLRQSRYTLAALGDSESSDKRAGIQDSSTDAVIPADAGKSVEEFFRDAKSGTGAEQAAEAPVRISVSEDGRLIVACDDPSALAEFGELLKRVARPVQSFEIFTMKYQSPYWVAMTLEEYFEMDADDDKGDPGFYYYYYGPGSRDKKKERNSLSKRRIPQFIYDDYTSTILVRDADTRQLQTIRELIKIYDAPSPADTRSMRVQQYFHLKNADAEIVAQAVKDVFRDLLSSNDKALEKPGSEQKQQSSRYDSYFGGGGDDDEDPVKFKGMLSIGVVSNSNTLVISSQKRLMPTIQDMIEELDTAAETSSGVRILQLDPSVDLGLIQQRLGSILKSESKDPAGRQPNPDGQNTKEQGKQPGQAVQQANFYN